MTQAAEFCAAPMYVPSYRRLREPGNCPIGSADVQFVEDVILVSDAGAVRIVPLEIAADHFRRRVPTVRL